MYNDNLWFFEQPLFWIIIALVGLFALTFRVTTAPNKRQIYTLGSPARVVDDGWTFIIPLIQTTKLVDCALTPHTIRVDVIAKGGTTVSLEIGVTIRVDEVTKYLINTNGRFNGILKNIVKSEASSKANDYSVSELAENKTVIIKYLEDQLNEMSSEKEWGVGEFQVTVGDPELSEDLKKAMMREEEVARENKANLAKATNQIKVGETLVKAAAIYKGNPEALWLRKTQVISDVASSGSLVLIDAGMDSTISPTDLGVGMAVEKTKKSEESKDSKESK